MKKTNDSVVVRAEAEIGDENELVDTGAKPTDDRTKKLDILLYEKKDRPHYLCVLFFQGDFQGTILLRLLFL